jgi:hypothetical protein
MEKLTNERLTKTKVEEAIRASRVAERWAAQYPQPREVRVYPGAVDVPIVWPLG